MKKVFVFVFVFVFQVLAYSKEYVGVNLCGKINIDSLLEFYNNSGAAAKVSLDNIELKNQAVSVSNYVIADRARNVQVSFFDGRAYYISVEPADGLDSIIEAKYGKPVGNKSFIVGDSPVFYSIYNIKDDPGVELSITPRYSVVSYTCRAIQKQKIDFEIKIRNKKALQIKGANGL